MCSIRAQLHVGQPRAQWVLANLAILRSAPLLRWPPPRPPARPWRSRCSSPPPPATTSCTSGPWSEDSATVPASGLPKFTTGWASLGGILTAGPAVAPVNGTLTFFAPSTGGRVYTRTPAAGYKATPWVCIGNPAAATSASGAATFACEGSDHALWESVSTSSGWPGTHSISGYGNSIVGSPALAGPSDGTVSFVEYTDRSAWEYVSPVFGWVGLGGTITGGIGAAAVG